MSDAIEQMLTFIDDKGDDAFTRMDITNAGIKSSALTALGTLVKRGLIEIIGNPAIKPQNLKKAEGPSLMEEYRVGNLRALYPQYKPKDKVNGEGEAAVQEVEREPVDEYIEIDPLEILDSIEPQDFGVLIAKYIEIKNNALGPLQERLNNALGELSTIRNQHAIEINEYDMKVKVMQQELKEERTRLIELRNTIAYENERRVRSEVPVKTVLIQRRGGDNLQRQHGSSGNAPASMKVHGKPFIGDHPAKPVVEHRKK